MPSLTVDYGIDLGTTNSVIAKMGAKGPEPIQNNDQQFATPSAVGVSPKGQLKVGRAALRPDYYPQLCFKRHMGSTLMLPMADDSEWSPSQLSAEVLKDLKASAKRRYNEDVASVVITVPAMFNQPQCAATQAAAKQAGLNVVALLQEPIAAATAFLSASPEDGYYLVYDLGGGTFDCSLIHLGDGEMNVVEHGGDNYLGGTDFDRAILDWTLSQLRKKGCKPDAFQLENSKGRFLILQEIERARIALSDKEEEMIDLGDFDLPVDSLRLTREQLEAMVEPLVDRTIEVAEDRLRSRKLAATDVRAILLVGGPTRMPYVRNRLEQLGIPLNHERDPMTVVAEGAAIHAGTILRREERTATAGFDDDVLEIELHYDPVTPDTHAQVAGRVVGPQAFKGDIRVVATAGHWESGWIPLVKGAFLIEIGIKAGAIAEFTIEGRDSSGRSLPVEPRGFAIRSGVRTAQAVLPYNYGIASATYELEVLLRAGTPLPTPAEPVRFLATVDVPAGSSEELKLFFLEGNSRVTSENIMVGELVIRGTDLQRSIKEGQPVEVRMKCDEDRLLTAKVFLPVQDMEFSVAFHPFEDKPNLDEIRNGLSSTALALSRVADQVTEEDQDIVLRTESRLEQLDAEFVERAEKGEMGEAERIRKQLSDVRGMLRPLLDKYGLPALHVRALKTISDARHWADQFDDQMDVGRLDDMKVEADRYLKLADEVRLQETRDRASGLFWKHYGKTKECWDGQVSTLRARATWALDEYAYHEYVKRAEACIAENDFSGARLNVIRAWDLLPDTERIENGLRSDIERS